MWEEKEPDPGGTTKVPSPRELSDLKDQNEQQLVLIAQLKEMLRKEQSTVSQDKVEEYVNTLNRARAKKSKQKKSEVSSSSETTSSNVNIDANKKERVNLLRQQLEENKAKLAERGKSQKGIEKMVTQLQAQFKEAPSLNTSLVETKTLDYNETTSQKDLYNILLTKEKKVTELLNKSQKLESQVLDLQENLKEKDSVIDARTKAITLMTDSLSKKGKTTLDALEETKDQMRKMQENFVTLESEMKSRQITLLNDLKMKNFEISELQEAKAELEQKLLLPENNSDMNVDELSRLQAENKLLREKIDSLERVSDKDVIAELSQEKANLKKIAEDFQQENQKLTEENKHLGEKLEQALRKSDEAASKEIEELRKQNANLSEDTTKYLSRINELEKQLEDAVTDLKLLKNTGMGDIAKSAKGENEEIIKLKKQLDESNKSMIKMRANQKSKIKDLNKKLDQFKKMNDANVLIAQLQNEISKLNEKIAELEDEKGNLQLKMVDSTSSSKDGSEEETKQMKENLNKTLEALSEREKVIEFLEAEVLALKADLKQKNEEEIKVSSQVSSEMSSICLEEQIETLELEKKKLLEQLEELCTEKTNLLQELEAVKKEKCDLSAKLDLYIQENMELIDKLEKLSAEKVSSAESIEFVEGLTQQEKLELAAYQKHINPEDSIKCPEGDTVEPPAELNESVLQLSEDTAELLQKIEMFTQERKEVMQKMEALRDENATLTIKVKEIENNRDILEETYEQLQNEKDALVNEKQELIDQLESSRQNRADEKNEPSLKSELEDLHTKYDALIQENNELKRTLKDFDSIVQEKYDLETRLGEVIDNNTSLDTKLNSNLDEINAYQLTIEENKAELINSAEAINRLHGKLEERENDIQELHINIDELNSVVNELQSKQSNIDLMENELSSLKSTLSDQIVQVGDYEKINEELLKVKKRIVELENELELKEGEIEKLVKDVTNKNEIVKKLQKDAEEKDEAFRKLNEDLRGKYLQLQAQLEKNDGFLRQQVDELTNKNKDQLEKMKKLAANLKKKTQAYQELQETFKNEKEKWENEDKEKIENNRLLKEQLDASQHYIQELKSTQEISLQQEMSASLHEEIDTNFAQNDPYQKLTELQLLLETNESELNRYKVNIDKLQEDCRKFQEAKTELEAVNNELMEKLNLTSNSFKEKALLEDQLELRLAEVTANDEIISKKLQEVQSERDDLLRKNQEHEELIKRLKIKLKKAHDKVTELKTVQNNLQDLESANQALKTQVATLEESYRHIQSENESLQRRNNSDYEKIEADYLVQLDELLKAKNELTTDNEKALERIKELEEREQELSQELLETAEKLKAIENEMENAKNELEKLKTVDISELRRQLEAAENALSLSNQESEAWKQEVDTLKQTISALEFAKATLEASCESSNKLELVPPPVTESTPTFPRLPGQDKPNNLVLEDGWVEVERLKDEIVRLKRENADLQASLEASGKVETCLSAETIPNFQWPSNQEKLANVMLGNTKDFVSMETPQKSEVTYFDPVSSEAYESSQKLQSIPTSFCESIPNFMWPSGQEKLSNFVPEESTSLENKQLKDEIARLKEEIRVLQSVKLESVASSQATHQSLVPEDTSGGMIQLKDEIVRLRQENAALHFAKSSLEASYESAQKLDPVTLSSTHLFESAQGFADELKPKKLVLEQVGPETQLFDASNEIKSLREEILKLNAEIDCLRFARTSASNQTEEVKSSNVPNFNVFSSVSTQSPADSQSQLFPPVIEEGREALLKKIKTLEFLLYNIDKEKEIALEQCTEMVNELTQIIYNEIKPSSQDTQDHLESQILSSMDIAQMAQDKKALQNVEYSKTDTNYGEQAQPVEEKVIQPKKAYLCSEKMQDLESEILTDKDIVVDRKALERLEYEQVDQNLGEQQQPVVEALAQPKRAYLCYTKDDKPQSLEAFEENDDGWGWAPEEATLEDEHVKSLLLEMQQLKDTIKVLQMEKENHLEEIRQLQIKSGKLIKKCKELKMKSNKKEEDGAGFFDLNETIVEELKGQVQNLEKKLKEISNELEKEKAEKSNLAKRVDVLTSANERMVEMKEIQDSEVLRWQRKHQEVVQKLEEYEWASDGFAGIQKKSEPETIDQTDRIKHLEETIKELNLDNEELQKLLEEQTSKRLEAEKIKHTGSAEELAEIVSRNEALHKELNEIKMETSNLQENVRQLHQVVHDKELTIAELQREIDELNKACKEKDVIIEDLQNNLDHLADRKLELDQMIVQLRQELHQLQCEVERLNSLTLKSDIEQSEKQVVELQMRIKQLEDRTENDKETIAKLHQEQSTQSQELNMQIEHLNALILDRDANINNLQLNTERLMSERNSFEENIKKLEAVREERERDYGNISKELQEKIMEVHQTQSLVGELQGRIRELEEFSQEKNKKDEENKMLLLQLEEKQRILDQLASNNQNDLLTQEIEELKAESIAKDAEVQKLLSEIQRKEGDFQIRVDALVNELNESWQVQVDQRGADVAESWKIHLEMVEKDFANIEEKLKNDITELEEKCGTLITENDELKKRMDQDIKCDVESFSALQQTISNLNQALKEKEKQIEEIQNNLEREVQAQKAESLEKDQKLASIDIIIKTTQKQFDEKREVVEAIISTLEKRALAPISYEKEDILAEFERQLSSGTQVIQELEGKLNRLSGEKSREITGLNQVIEDLEREVGLVHEREAEIARLRAEFERLEQEHVKCVDTMHIQERTLREYQEDQLSLTRKLDAKSEEITELNKRLATLQGSESENNRALENANSALRTMQEDYLNLQAALAACQKELQEATELLAQKSMDLDLANENLVRFQQNYSYYEQEHNRLKELLEQKEVEYNKSLEMLQNNQLADVQRHFDELLSNKDIDIATLRGQVQELIKSNQEYSERLNRELSSRETLEQQLKERTQLVDEDTKQLEELKLIIEDQVTKIEQLKKELFDKSNQYDSLIAEIDVGRHPVTRQPVAATVETPSTAIQRRPYVEEDLSEPVSRAELDLALYMLHQRDVRCEELTVEVTHLLEERDTLQLRLSNAIREKEELTRSLPYQPQSSSDPTQSKTEGSAFESGIEPAKDALEPGQTLATKLSELKNVGYKRDKTFVDEQEARRMQQLAIMQQHINEASKLPPEAAAKLVDASYTLSRDVQSPSKVLLNWLWGKSPPKANDS